MISAFFYFGRDPGEARTLDPMIKSHLLYQLSYGVRMLYAAFPLLRCKVTTIFYYGKIFDEKI